MLGFVLTFTFFLKLFIIIVLNFFNFAEAQGNLNVFYKN
jgi:hypothetical protein